MNKLKKRNETATSVTICMGLPKETILPDHCDSPVFWAKRFPSDSAENELFNILANLDGLGWIRKEPTKDELELAWRERIDYSFDFEEERKKIDKWEKDYQWCIEHDYNLDYAEEYDKFYKGIQDELTYFVFTFRKKQHKEIFLEAISHLMW